jgi:chitodextrinase
MKKILFSLTLATIMLFGSLALADSPVAPTDLTATSTSPMNINLTWSASTGAIGYQIFRNTTVTPIATTSNTVYLDSGLIPNTLYTYWVTAYDASSTISALSTSTAATTQADISAPSVPLNLTALSASISQINLSWSASADNVAVAGYVVYRNSSPLATTTALTYNDIGLASTTTYTYNVLAFDAAGNYSSLSASASAQPQNDTTAPSIPTNLSAAAISSSQINLSWTASTDNLGVAGYRIYRDEILVNTSASTTFSDIGLTATTTYAYQVSAFDAAGNASATSTTVTATTFGQSITPGGLVNISIKNGDKKGKLINLNSNEIIKVIVYSSANFNARDIVNSSVRFGGAKAITWRFRFANHNRKLDREFDFRVNQMTDLLNTDTTATFTATLKNGQTIYGQAKVRVINSKKKRIEKHPPKKDKESGDRKSGEGKNDEQGNNGFKNFNKGLNLNIASSTWATTTPPGWINGNKWFNFGSSTATSTWQKVIPDSKTNFGKNEKQGNGKNNKPSVGNGKNNERNNIPKMNSNKRK